MVAASRIHHALNVPTGTTAFNNTFSTRHRPPRCGTLPTVVLLHRAKIQVRRPQCGYSMALLVSLNTVCSQNKNFSSRSSYNLNAAPIFQQASIVILTRRWYVCLLKCFRKGAQFSSLGCS